MPGGLGVVSGYKNMARIQVKAQSATLEFFVGENLCPFVTRYQYNNLELRPTHLINSDLGENLSPRHFLPSKPSSFQALQFFAPLPLSPSQHCLGEGKPLQKVSFQLVITVLSYISPVKTSTPTLINHGNCSRNPEESWFFRLWVGLPQVLQDQAGTSSQKRPETRPRRPKKNYSLPKSGTGSHLDIHVLLFQTPV